MKIKIRNRLLCAAAIISLLVTVVSAAAYGSFRGGSSYVIAPGTKLTGGVWYNADIPRSENYIEYTPGGAVKPVVAYGSKLYGTSTYDTVASYLSSKGMSVLAAINGDFFNMTTGLPNGIVVTDGIVRGSDGYQNAVGFKANGTAIIGKPSMKVSAALPSGTIPVFSINRAFSSAGVFLYTPDFSATTRTSLEALYVTLKPTSGELTLSGSVTAEVLTSFVRSSPLSIPEGCMILAVTANNSNYSKLSALNTGDSVTITVSCAEGWSDVVYAVGTNRILVQNGSAAAGLDQDKAPRTAVGVRQDGSIVFYTVDGRQQGSSLGAGLKEVAARMVELGCKTAAELDGGGSTVMGVVYPGLGEFSTVNSPSDGSPRKCANFIFLVNTAPSTGSASSLHVYPYRENALSGAQITFRAAASDSAYHAAPVPGAPSFGATGGTVTREGVWTAPNTAGNVTISAQAGWLSASATVNVVTAPDTLDILSGKTNMTGKTLTVAAGSKTDLTAAARSGGLPMVSQDEQFTWSTSGGVGEIDGSGVFTAAKLEAGGTGKVTVSFGSVSASVEIKVAGDTVMLQDFENFADSVSEGQNATLSLCRDLTLVKYGTRSSCLAYSGSQNGLSADVPFSAPLAKGFERLCMWIKGDGSKNSLYVSFAQADSPVRLASLGSREWVFASVVIPSGASAVTGFSVLPPEGASTGQGKVYIDTVYQSKSGSADTTAPTVYFDQSGTGPATVLDSGRGVPFSNLKVTLDRQPLVFSYKATSGLLTPVIPALTPGEHLLTVTASDVYGNVASATLSLNGGAVKDPFADTGSHWARENITYLAGHGIVTGSVVSGSSVFRPDDKITRAEFAVMLSRWLGTNTAEYTNTVLPFADSAAIPEWAVPHVKAMYSLGIVTGSSDNGRLMFNPDENITRAQVMAMIGRTQPMGYGEAPLDFTDASKVPAWAEPFVRALVKRGVVNGSGGLIKPDGSATRAEVAKMLYSMG